MPTPNSRARLVLASTAAVVLSLLVPGGAQGAFPGNNGNIFYGRKPFHKPQGIYSVDPKGGKSTLLTEGAGSSGVPSVSADGTELVFIGSPGPHERGIFTM